MLGFLEPVHNLAKDVRTIDECLTVGVFWGVQQALLNTVGFKVFNNTL